MSAVTGLRLWLAVLVLAACHESSESEPDAGVDRGAATGASSDGGQAEAAPRSAEGASSSARGGRGGSGGDGAGRGGAGAGGGGDGAAGSGGGHAGGGTGGGAGTDVGSAGSDGAGEGGNGGAGNGGSGGDDPGPDDCVSVPALCDDGNACTVDICNPANGQCVHNARSCDDTNACTVDACDPAAGCRHTPVVCDDDDICTDDDCEPGLGCIARNNSASCDDGNACTDADVCANGACAGSARSCSDGNPCTNDSCAANGACVHTDNSAPCNDGNSCTTADRCGGGSCQPGTDDACGEGQISCTPGQPNLCLCEEGYEARNGRCLFGPPVIPEITGTCPLFRGSTITFGGVSGIALVAGTKAASATAPMVMYWHATGSHSGEYEGMATAVYQGVVAQGGVLVSFEGSSGVGDSSCSGTNIFSLGDMDIVDQLVACAVRDHNVDPRRIYTTGCSAGGLFATCLAARRSGYIAAVAPNSGGLFPSPQPFQTDDTPALMTVHGAPGVDVVIIDFSVTSATADTAFSARGGFVVNCNHGGTHCGGAGLAPYIWEFFQAHPFGVDPSPYASGLPASFPNYCTIFE